MIGDELDFFIIRFFLENKHRNITTWDIMKSYHQKQNFLDKIKERGNEEREHILIKRRINRMVEEGIFIKKMNGGNRYVYILIKEMARICRHRFPEGYKKSLVIKTLKGWCAFEIKN